MDEAILAIASALAAGDTIDAIHSACIEKGRTEEEIFLAIKGAQILHKAIAEQEKELKNRPPPFGRKQ